MKLVYISRAYPPIVGGLEKHNQAIHEALQRKAQVKAIINRKGKKALFWFMPYAAFNALLAASRYDAVLLGDGVLAAVGWIIKLFRPNIPVVCIVHGLDITFANPIYQFFWVRLFLAKMDKIIAVSNATAEETVQRGIATTKLAIIPNGINKQEYKNARDRKQLQELLKQDIEDKLVLFTIGRLVKRKGVNWFIAQVMPQIKDRCIYLIAGDGPEKTEIERTIKEKHLENAVYHFGFVSEELKSLLFSNSDLFVQPNIKVKGDMEGFGIAVLEANLNNLSVLGSRLEGLQDSIIENQNGWLIEPEDDIAYVQKINALSQSREELSQAGHKAKEFCLQNFTWERIAENYLAQLRTIIQ